MAGSHGWAEVDRTRKREIIDAIASGTSTKGPSHAELDLTDRCNVSCYFCNQQDVRTKEFVDINRVREMIDELADNGLKSVRLSGGGDPLFHKDITQIFEHLAARGIIVDNVTTNAVLLTPQIAALLVRDKAREVVVSLNAIDPADYARMMRVKPALFDRVLDNVRHLVALRSEGYPTISLQFLLDRGNCARVEEMYDLGVSLGVDRIVMNPVMEIPLERIDGHNLLADHEHAEHREHFRRIFEKDRERRLLQISFVAKPWMQMIEEVKLETGYVPANLYPTAPSFREENGQCFFAWYSMTVRGNGDLYPCCLLLNPEYEPLGNARTGKLADHWNGPRFNRLRSEMREVMLAGGRVFFQPKRFKEIRKQCAEPHACWLKNMYFRGDDEFYAELAQAMETARKREVRLAGTPKQMMRAIETAAYDRRSLRSMYERVRIATWPFRAWLKRRLGMNVAGPNVHEAAPRDVS